MDSTIQKSPEMATIISNIGSLIDQLKQMTAGEAVKEEPKEEITAEQIEKILKEMDGEKDEDKKEEVAKAVAPAANSPQDKGETASSDSDEIIGEATDTQDKNLKEIEKALKKMLEKKVNKSSSAKDDAMLKAIQLIVDDNRELRKGLENIYEGLGIATEIKKLNEVKKSQEYQRPINDPSEIQKSIDEIKNMLGTAKAEKTEQSLQKSLSDESVLRGIFSYNSKR
jgi:hypothetical protein